jgi:hypothetical protein
MKIRVKYEKKNYGTGDNVDEWQLSIKGRTSPLEKNPEDHPPKKISMIFKPTSPAPGIARSQSDRAPDSNCKEMELTLTIKECRRLLKALASYVDQVELIGTRAEIKIPMQSQ